MIIKFMFYKLFQGFSLKKDLIGLLLQGLIFVNSLPQLLTKSHKNKAEKSALRQKIERMLSTLRQKNGADDGARTRYLHLGKVALYQMSYIRKLWCLRSESNQRHVDFQSTALPTELQRQMCADRRNYPLFWRPGTGSNRRPLA